MPGSRYGASGSSPRQDPSFNFEEGYADPTRTIGPIRAVTAVPTIVAGPFSVGADTGCANAALRVTGGGHITARLGVGTCPVSSTPGIDVAGSVVPTNDGNPLVLLGSSAIAWAQAFIFANYPTTASGIYFNNTNVTKGIIACNPTDSSLVFSSGASAIAKLTGGPNTWSPFTDGTAALGSSGTEWSNTWTKSLNVTTGVAAIQTGTLVSVALRIIASPTTNTLQYGVYNSVTGSSAATTSITGDYIIANTAAAGFTCTSVYGSYIDTASKGAGSTITTLYGLYIASQTAGATNYAIYTNTGTVRLGDAIQTAAGQESTGGGSAALGANSPAVTNAAPYKWLKFLTSDGSTVYVPAWK